MTNAAVIKAVYADLRFVKTRKVAQLVLELPIEKAKDAFDTLGAPDPAESQWVAVAPLKPEAVKKDSGSDAGPPSLASDGGGVEAGGSSPAPPPQKSEGERAIAQFYACCSDEAFLEWFGAEIAPRSPYTFTAWQLSTANEAIKRFLEIVSAKEIRDIPEARERWKRLHDSYTAWRDYPEMRR